MRRPVSVKPPFSKSRWSCRVYGADQREAAVNFKRHDVHFSFWERFLFFYCRIARLVAEQIGTVQQVGILVLAGCHRRLALCPPLAPLPFALALSSWARCQMGSLVLGG